MKFPHYFYCLVLQWRFPEKKRRAPKRVLCYLGLETRADFFALELLAAIQPSGGDTKFDIGLWFLSYGFQALGLGNYF